MADLSIERLRQFVVYEPDTGRLFWRPRGNIAWDIRYAGTVALHCLNSGGYRSGSVDRVSVKAHRAAWALQHGRWPTEIDHINGRRADNRLENLREVSRATNCRNRGLRNDNMSGIVGVGFHLRSGKWRARIQIDGRSVSLGSFWRKQDAINARRLAEIRHGFGPNHGAKHGG
jgi:hypothetical protein